MPFKVVHANDGFAKRKRERTGHARAHEQGARETGAAGVGHGVHAAQVLAGLAEDLLGQGDDAADVIAAGEFGHHAAVIGMHGDLGVQGMGEQARGGPALPFDQGDAGFVTRRFNAQDPHGGGLWHAGLCGARGGLGGRVGLRAAWTSGWGWDGYMHITKSSNDYRNMSA